MNRWYIRRFRNMKSSFKMGDYARSFDSWDEFSDLIKKLSPISYLIPEDLELTLDEYLDIFTEPTEGWIICEFSDGELTLFHLDHIFIDD